MDEEEMRAFELLYPFWKAHKSPDSLTARLIFTYRRESRTYRSRYQPPKKRITNRDHRHSIRDNSTGRFVQ